MPTITTATSQGSKTAGELVFRGTLSNTVNCLLKENQRSDQKNAGTPKGLVWKQKNLWNIT